MAKRYRIAVIPGDGIGKETVPEGLRVLDAAATRFGFELELAHYDWSCETYQQTGAMMPKDGLDQLRRSDSIFLGAVGWPGVPDHISLWGLLIPIRRGFDQYVNLRPCRLMPGAKTPLANRTEKDIDFYVVRENTEGEYSSSGGRMFEGTDREFVTQQSVFTRYGTDRVLRYAFELAKTRARKHVTSATKSNGITFTMPYWDERFAEMGKHYPDIGTSQYPHRHPMRAFRSAPRLVRCRRRLQPVRRHPERPGPGSRRLHRNRAECEHQSRACASLDVRAGPWLGAGHRRQARLQSDRADVVRRDDARASRRSGRGPRDRRFDRKAAARRWPAHAGHGRAGGNGGRRQGARRSGSEGVGPGAALGAGDRHIMSVVCANEQTPPGR